MIGFILACANCVLAVSTINISLLQNSITYKKRKAHRIFTVIVSLASMYYIVYTY